MKAFDTDKQNQTCVFHTLVTQYKCKPSCVFHTLVTQYKCKSSCVFHTLVTQYKYKPSCVFHTLVTQYKCKPSCVFVARKCDAWQAPRPAKGYRHSGIVNCAIQHPNICLIKIITIIIIITIQYE